MQSMIQNKVNPVHTLEDSICASAWIFSIKPALWQPRVSESCSKGIKLSKHLGKKSPSRSLGSLSEKKNPLALGFFPDVCSALMSEKVKGSASVCGSCCHVSPKFLCREGKFQRGARGEISKRGSLREREHQRMQFVEHKLYFPIKTNDQAQESNYYIKCIKQQTFFAAF